MLPRTASIVDALTSGSMLDTPHPPFLAVAAESAGLAGIFVLLPHPFLSQNGFVQQLVPNVHLFHSRFFFLVEIETQHISGR